MTQSSTGPARRAVLAIDQGTTNTKAIVVSDTGEILAAGSAGVALSHPRPGWVEQDAEQIWTSVLAALAYALSRTDVSLAGIALSTQRESVVAWSRSTGLPLAPLLGWQDRRTADRWAPVVADPPAVVRERTGLRIDAMFSGPKLNWLLEHLADHPVADLCVGTVDAWLVWRLTGGARHACDAGNASRTLLYDVRDLAWSDDLLELFGVPASVLPEVLASDGSFGQTKNVPGVPDGVPIVAVLADSHAALYGQGCTEVGTAKATYGTGTSVMVPEPAFVDRDSPVPTTLAWLTDRPTYAREGNILSSGSALAWTAATLGLAQVADLVALAGTVPDSAGVVLMPAFSGLGAPHWNRDVQASLTGITSGTTRAHLARAAVDAVAHQIGDIADVIAADGSRLDVLRADGGATASDLLMQTQADLLDVRVEVAEVPEVSALGAAQLGWRALGAEADWQAGRAAPRTFVPEISADERAVRRTRWRTAVARSLDPAPTG
ncbi:MAG TPA: FGGY family carbohydrate kinase [Propionibacteriaceae bacterium]